MNEIRQAVKSELAWINERYDEVEFVHSCFDREVIAIAEIGSQKAGLGRIVMLSTRPDSSMIPYDSFTTQSASISTSHSLLMKPFTSKTCLLLVILGF